MRDEKPKPADAAEGDHAEPNTIVSPSAVDHAPLDPVLELLNRWEECDRRGEAMPADWTIGLDDATREDLRRRIERRKRLWALIDPERTVLERDALADAPLPSFPGYETLSRIGRGGMGSVFKARDADLDRIVAIKTIAEGRFATAEQRERFRSEARAVARLYHPNIIGIHAIGEHEGEPFLSLEFAEGGSLADRLAQQPMPAREAALLVETLARALHVAHRLGVVHRDLKPSNILLTAQGVPKVSDFGLAKLMDADGGRTVSGQVMGSPSFMAPEQAEGHTRAVGPAADIYALGAILYTALTGRPPFLGESQLETLKLVVSNDAVPPRRLRPDVPLDLETICLRCLEKEPARRYPDAESLANDLRQQLDGRPIRARRAGPVERIWRWCRRNRGLAAASLAAVVLAAALIAGAAASAIVFRGQRDRIAADLVRIRRSEAATIAERDKALAAERAASRSRSEAQSVLEFFKNKVLAAARPTDQEGGLGIEVPLRRALDAAESGIEASFRDQPALEASIRSALGETYYYIGDPEHATRQFERALERRRQALGADHPDTLHSADDLAVLYLNLGRIDQALALVQDTLERRRRLFGPDDPETLTSRHNLAAVYQAAGRLTEALALLREVVDRRREKLGADHYETLMSMNNLASVSREAGRYDEAIPLYEDTLRRRRVVLGPDHPETLVTINNLANAYREQGRLPESIALLEEALARQEAKLTRDHPDTLFSMSNLGLAYKEGGHLDKALPLLEETLQRRRAKLGSDHPDTLVSMSNLAGAYLAANRTADAVPLLEETLELRRKTRGPEHPQTLRSMNALARVYVTEQPARAEAIMRQALEIGRRKYPDDWRTFEAQALLGAGLLEQKRYAEAEPHLLAGHEGLAARESKMPQPYRRILAETVERLIRLYEAQGLPEKAEMWRKTPRPSS